MLELARLVRARIGALYKVLPTAVFAAAMRPSITRRDLEARIDRLIEELAARHANLGVHQRPRRRSRRRAEPLETRGIVVAERGRFRVRERTVLRYYARTHRAPAASTARPDALMLDSASKAFFHLLAQSQTLKTLASRYGMRRPASFARRFIAGETVDEAIEAARARRGARPAHDARPASARASPRSPTPTPRRATTSRVIDAIVAAGIGRNISLKLTQLGLDVDKASAVDNLRKILERAEPAGFFVRIDMENSPYTEVTLEIFETLWRHGLPPDRRRAAVGAAPQRGRTCATMNALGARVRLVKGAYKEPKTVAYQKKADVDAAYARMLKTLLTRRPLSGDRHARSGDDRRWRAHARANTSVAPDRFEFQMLYGVRRDLQAMLVKAGYRVRVYIPFGREWFPYFMRRLGERPANVRFVIRGHSRREWVIRCSTDRTPAASFSLRLRQPFPQRTRLRRTVRICCGSQPQSRWTLTPLSAFPARLLISPEPQRPLRHPTKGGRKRLEELERDMVTNYPHPMTAHEGMRDSSDRAGAVARVMESLRQVMCGLRGHDTLLHFERRAHVAALRLVRTRDAGMGAERSAADGDGARRCAASYAGARRSWSANDGKSRSHTRQPPH